MLPPAALALLLATAAAFAQAPEPSATVRFDLPDEGVTIPLTIADGQPIVAVRIAGKGPFEFWLDTGAGGQGILSRALARRLALPKVGTRALTDSTRIVHGDLHAVAELALGDLRFRDLRMVSVDKKGKPAWEKKGIDGVLGYALFRELLLTLDYRARTVRITRGALEPSGDVVPYRLHRGVPQVPITIGAVTLDADIDSGSMGGLVVAESVRAEIDWATEPSAVGKIRTAFHEGTVHAGRARQPLHLGGVEIPLPTIEVTSLFAGRKAIVGAKLLRKLRVTFDGPQWLVRFEGPFEPPDSILGRDPRSP